MVTVATDEPAAASATAAIHGGDVEGLGRLLAEHPWLATADLGTDEPGGMTRTLLHVVTDWPGHHPRGAETVALLVRSGADVDARFHGPHEETPLHWAASCDDVAVLDALLDAGADIEAPGSVLGGGPPLTDACGFKQWRVGMRLVERGARVTLWDAAALGLLDRVRDLVPAAGPQEIDPAFWMACHGGRGDCAEFLLDRGADIDRIPHWENLTPLDAAEREGAAELVARLRARGARSASEISR